MEGEKAQPIQQPNPTYWTRFWAIKSADVRQEIIAELKRYERACTRENVPESLRDYNAALFELLEMADKGIPFKDKPVDAETIWLATRPPRAYEQYRSPKRGYDILAA
jgi:hypothetical protein